MSLALKTLCLCKRHIGCRFLRTARCYSVTGNQKTDSAFSMLTGGRIESWMTKYENLVGLTEVKEAQTKVIEAERAFQDVQAVRRQRQQEMTSIQSKLKEIHAQLDKVQRGDERYLVLLTEEYEIMKEEKNVISDLGNYDQLERDNFAALSSAVRESHERERTRAERTKYWSIIGSVIGAAIGIIGTSVNNYLRMRELKGLVKESTTGGFELKGIVMQLSETMKTQYSQVQALISEFKSYLGSPGDDGRVLESMPNNLASSNSISDANLEAQTKEILDFVKKQDEVLELEIKEIKKLMALGSNLDQEKTIVYVGPEIESLLEKTEANLEWKMKSNALLTTTFVYGAFMVSLSILYHIFKGGAAS